MKIEKEIDLKTKNSFRIGGLAHNYVEIKEKEELLEALNYAEDNNLEIFFMGGGTNLLINDLGVDKFVIKIMNNDINVRGERLDCGAGAALMRVSRTASSRELEGLEWSVGVPGTLGGAIRGNAGAYGVYIGDSIETVEVYDISKKRFVIFSKNDCQSEYKTSIFSFNKNLLVWRVIFKLKEGIGEDIKEKMNKYMEHRMSSQPRLPSAGCIFKNIKLSDLENENPVLANEIKSENELFVKRGMVPVAWLIEQLGLKGHVIGDAKISLEHANFIVNTSNASSEDVIIMISFIKQQVRDKFGIQLHEEIEYLGF